ncbi:hypothetical protein APR04_005405 [Promicromonospora umidemergens]|nr:hypothetical protein [Promicromonospora umidemergens]
MRIFPVLTYSGTMSDSVPWDDAAPTLQAALAREAHRLTSSRNVFALINPDGLLTLKDGTPREVREAADPLHGAAARVAVVDPRGGAAGIGGYRPEAARDVPEEYPVNPVARRVRAALAAGAGQAVPDEELRGNLALCAVDVDGKTEVGLTGWQQELIRVAHHAAHAASGWLSSFRIVGRTGEAGASTVFLPGLRDPMSADSARLAAHLLTQVADSSDDVSSPSLRRSW